MWAATEIQIRDSWLEELWLPHCPELHELADVEFAHTREEAVARFPHAEAVFSWSEEDWVYEVMEECRDAAVEAGTLRWVQSSSSGVEALVPIWAGTDVVCTNAAGLYGPSLAEYVIGVVLHYNKKLDELATVAQTRTWTPFTPGDMETSTLGVVGYGGIVS